MTYTFADAKQRLAPHISGYGLLDVSAAVNEALEELASTRAWQRLRRLVRITIPGGPDAGVFSLPQDCGQMTRLSVSGSPVHIHGTDIEFLPGGPGDYDYTCDGYAPARGVQRLGVFPTMLPCPASSRLAAFSVNPPQGALRARVRTADGDVADVDVPCRTWEGTQAASALDPAQVQATAGSYEEVLGVTVPSDASAHISLYAVAGGELKFLSRMHPRVRVPEFVRYRIPGVSVAAGASYRAVAEVTVRPLPLVEDDDPLPLPGLRPLQYMLQAHRLVDSGEVRAAVEYRALAEAELLRRESAEGERQGLFILNQAEGCSTTCNQENI